MGTEAALPGVDQAVTRVARALGRDASLVVVRGQPGAGKSATLHALRAHPGLLSAERVVLVAPPRGDDTALVGLAEAAAELDQPDVVALVADARQTWAQKLAAVVDGLRGQAAATVLLFDAPVSPGSLGPIAPIFLRRAEELARALLGIPGLRRVVATNEAVLGANAEVNVVPMSMPDLELNPECWGSLRDAATRMQPFTATLSTSSPLDLRVRVALCASGVTADRAASARLSTRALVGQLFERIDATSLLRKVVGRLALMRMPFDHALLARFGAQQLDERARTILEHALLFGPKERLELHETVGWEAWQGGWIDDSERREAHSEAAQWHLGRFDCATHALESAAAIRHEIEAVHHFTEAGDAKAVLERSIFFVEQYDALGKKLSQQKQWMEAVDIYERALAHDPHDDYAHHYIGYNLDVLASDPDRAEAEFRAALVERDDHAWYHGRYVNFLLTRGRVGDARDAWENALARLLRSTGDPRLYRELHAETARLLLHRGRLDFADEVLADVPAPIAREQPWFHALDRLRRMLREAEREEIVFPPSLPDADRWQQGPHLLASEQDRARLCAWMPGRVTGVDDDDVHFRIARGPDAFDWLDLPLAEFKWLARFARERRATPAAGTYVEFIDLEGEKRFLLTHIRRAFADD